MIAYFPDPYPDELFYSICARYSDRMKYPKRKSILFDLTGSLRHITNKLPNLYQFTKQPQIFDKQFILQILTEHTLFPYYYPFIQKNKYDMLNKFIFGNVYEEDEAIRWARMFSKKHNNNKWMRFCPICAQEDNKYLGEIYWHRIHQIFGVEVCPKHNILLIDSNILFSNPHTGLITAENAIIKNHSYVIRRNTNKKLLIIAEDIEWILMQRGKIYFEGTALMKYRTLCKNIGLALPSGNICCEQIVYLIKQHYSNKFLKRLRCEIQDTYTCAWPVNLFKVHRECSTNPLRHILFLHTFGYRMREFEQLPME